MVHIYYTKLSGNIPDTLYYNYISRLSPPLQDKNSRYRRWQDKLLHLFGNMLLLKGLENYGVPPGAVKNIAYSSYGRPYLLQQPGIDFNISHSGDYVVCALSQSVKLGIDIEHINAVPFDDFRHVLTDAQWEIVHSAPDPLRRFFRFWTIKESIVKADGRGLSVSLSDIVIHEENATCGNDRWYYQEINIDNDYVACLATDASDKQVHLQYINCY